MQPKPMKTPSILATIFTSLTLSSFSHYHKPRKQNMETVQNPNTTQQQQQNHKNKTQKTNNNNNKKDMNNNKRGVQREQNQKKTKREVMEIEGYPIEGLSIGGHETCIILPSINLAFDIGRCPQRAIAQDFLFISHSHMDHIGGLPMYVATRGLYRMKPPTIIVPTHIKATVEELFEVHRKLDGSELNHVLIGLDVGEEFYVRKDLKVKAFKTYHAIRSQGYIVYSIKQKLKPEYLGLPGDEIKNLKSSGVEITNTLTVPEVAFTGDTMSDFIIDKDNVDALKAKILIMESTYVENTVPAEHAQDYGHTHLSEIIKYADKFQNKAILLIHFSARYTVEEIQEAVSKLPPPLAGRVFSLTEGF